VILNFTDKKNFAICRQLSKLFSAWREKNPIIIFSFSCQSPCQRATVANHDWKALYTSLLWTDRRKSPIRNGENPARQSGCFVRYRTFVKKNLVYS